MLDWYGQQRRAQTGSDFLPLHLQKVVAIACALRDRAGFKIASVGSTDDAEPELIRRFFDLVDKLVPQLVSWNGGGFDLPVLNHRALIHGVTAAKFWESGDDDRDFRYNSYLGRYHTRHLDLMDVLAMYQPRASAGLDAMARLCGFPGKLGMDGSEVHAAVQQGTPRPGPPLLRDGRHEHVPALPALPAAARRTVGRGVREGGVVRARADRRIGRAAMARIHRRVGRERNGAVVARRLALRPNETAARGRPFVEASCGQARRRIPISISSPAPIRSRGAGSGTAVTMKKAAPGTPTVCVPVMRVRTGRQEKHSVAKTRVGEAGELVVAAAYPGVTGCRRRSADRNEAVEELELVDRLETVRHR